MAKTPKCNGKYHFVICYIFLLHIEIFFSLQSLFFGVQFEPFVAQKTEVYQEDQQLDIPTLKLMDKFHANAPEGHLPVRASPDGSCLLHR